MTEKIVNAALEIDYNTDTYKTALVKTYDVLDDIYEEVNLLYTMSYTTNGTSPSAPEAGTLWLDGRTTPPILKYWDGADSWDNVTGSALFTSGVGLDTAFKMYSNRMILQLNSNYPCAVLKIAATSDEPATISIQGVLLQNTSNVTVTLSGTAGLYDIWAQRPGGTGTGFTLTFVAADGTPTFAYEQVRIGRIYWNSTSVIAIRSFETELDGTNHQMPPEMVYVTKSAPQSVTTSYAIMKHDVVTLNYNSCYNASTGLYTAPKAGLYEFEAQWTCSTGAGVINGSWIAIYVNGAKVAEELDGASGTHTTRIHYFAWLAQGDTVGVYAKNQTGTVNTNAGSIGADSFFARYIAS